MAEPNEIANGDKAVAPESKPESKVEAKAESKTELPTVESPPLSPAEKLSEPVLEAQMKPQPAPAPEMKPQAASPAPEVKPAPATAAPANPATPRVSMPKVKIPPLKIPAMKIPDVKIAPPKVSRRMRRRVALAATIMLAAGFGAAVGAVANRAPVQPPPKPDTALIEENHALQRSVAKLNKDLTTLKANVESAARESKTQIAKATASLSDRIDKAIDVTGSIGKPATAPAATNAAGTPPTTLEKQAEKLESAPLPQPRPAIVQGWTIREARNGRIWVENRGAMYAVAPGVPLPGLGRVETIRREGNSLVVVTTKGLITEGQSTASVRPRQQRYYTPYWQHY
jgi:hypothetical protein